MFTRVGFRKAWCISIALTLAVLPTLITSPATAEPTPPALPLTVEIVSPTTPPNPRVETPIVIPVDVPIAEAIFPIVLVGLQPYSLVEIYSNSTPVLIASGYADGNGRFETSVKVPPNLASGEHTITATNILADGTKISAVLAAFAVTAGGTVGPSAAVAQSPSSTSGQGAASGSSVTVTEESPKGTAATAALGPDPFNVGGILYTGGLVAHVFYPDGIYRPGVEMFLVVRNVSTSALHAFVTVDVTNLFGVSVAHLDEFEIQELVPGESRRIIARVRDIGQWGIYDAHLTIAPRSVLGGTQPEPFTRSAGFLAFEAILVIALWILIVVVGGYLFGYFFLGWPAPHKIFTRSRNKAESASSDGVVETANVVAANATVGASVSAEDLSGATEHVTSPLAPAQSVVPSAGTAVGASTTGSTSKPPAKKATQEKSAAPAQKATQAKTSTPDKKVTQAKTSTPAKKVTQVKPATSPTPGAPKPVSKAAEAQDKPQVPSKPGTTRKPPAKPPAKEQDKPETPPKPATTRKPPAKPNKDKGEEK
jgi:hypothetical protein